jgi:hypothetical protein
LRSVPTITPECACIVLGLSVAWLGYAFCQGPATPPRACCRRLKVPELHASVDRNVWNADLDRHRVHDDRYLAEAVDGGQPFHLTIVAQLYLAHSHECSTFSCLSLNFPHNSIHSPLRIRTRRRPLHISDHRPIPIIPCLQHRLNPR